MGGIVRDNSGSCICCMFDLPPVCRDSEEAEARAILALLLCCSKQDLQLQPEAYPGVPWAPPPKLRMLFHLLKFVLIVANVKAHREVFKLAPPSISS
jgi:hypothetical protein